MPGGPCWSADCVLRCYGENEIVQRLLAVLRSAAGASVHLAHDWPSIPCASVLNNWARGRSDVLIPYSEARAGHAALAAITEELDRCTGMW